MTSNQSRIEGYRLAFRRLAAPAFLGVLLLVVLGLTLALAVRQGDLAVDFHNELYPQAKLVLHGTSPYPPPGSDLSSGANAIWPVAALVPVFPLTLLSRGAADGAWTALVIVSLLATLLVLGVRDWRVVGVTFLWPPVISAIQTANLTLPLGLLIALAWRCRNQRGAPGAAVGVAIAVKFFVWPFLPFLAWKRRWMDAAAASAVAACSLLLLLPFIDLGDYVRLLRDLSNTFDGRSYTLYGLLTSAHAGGEAARIATIALGAIVLVLAVVLRSLALTIGAALALSPIVWLHFFALLVVPLAIVRPRFGLLWLLPIATIVTPGTGNGRPWQSALVLLVAGAMLAWCARDERVVDISD